MNIDEKEVNKFADLASRWWDPQSEFKPLHAINPLRLDYIQTHAGALAGKKILDVGCGGGILSESMARLGAEVTGIDVAEAGLEVAKLHLLESGQKVEYIHTTAEEFAPTHAGEFDVITCMEMLEHVPDPSSVIDACASMLKSSGVGFFSTLNRNLKSYLFAIIGAEYVLNLLPKGTHDHDKFIKPSEMDAWLRAADLSTLDITGMSYNPISKIYRLGRDVSVNYLLASLKA